MSRIRRLTALAVAGGLAWTSAAQGQVHVRVPFVRVQVGGPYPGVMVRAPLVNVYSPDYPPPAYVSPAVPPLEVAPPPAPFPPAPPADFAPPPAPAVPVTTIEEFARTFVPRPGTFEATLLNPVTRLPTPVRFTLPAGTPRRVHVHRREIEFDYGPRQFVRIEFDRDGAQVVAR